MTEARISPELWQAMTWSEVSVECRDHRPRNWFHGAKRLPSAMMERLLEEGEVFIGGMHGPRSRTVYPTKHRD